MMTALPTLAVKNGRKPAAIAGHGRLAAAYLAPGMLGFLIFIVLPLVASLVISLFDWPLFGTPEFVGLDNYTRMLTGDPVFWTVLGNTLFFAVSYTVLNLVLALALSTWLHHLGSWGPFFRVLFFIPVVTPMVANALVWRLMLTDDGVVNSFLATFGIDGPSWLSDSQLAMGSLIAMSVWQGIGYNIIVLGAGLKVGAVGAARGTVPSVESAVKDWAGNKPESDVAVVEALLESGRPLVTTPSWNQVETTFTQYSGEGFRGSKSAQELLSTIMNSAK